MLKLGEEALDAPAVLVGDAVVFALQLAVPARGDDDSSALRLDFLAQAVGVIGLVGKNLTCLKPVDQIAGWGHVILLAGAEDKAHRQAQRINYGVDFRSEPAA